MKKNCLLSLICVLFSLTLCSQNNVNPGENPVKKKEHYKIINNGNDDPLTLEKLLPNASLDSLRFLNERRHIPVAGTSLVVELFSAQELFDVYKKPISSLTIIDPSSARKVKLRLTRSVGIEVIPQ